MEPETLDPLNGMESQAPDPLKGVPVPNSTMDTTDDEAINRRSSMYAMGKLASMPTANKESIWELYGEASQANKDIIKMTGDDQQRREAEVDALNSAVDSLTSMAMNSQDYAVENASRVALGLTLQEKANQTAMAEAERKWAEAIVAMRDNGDDMKAELNILQHDTPDVFDNLIDIQTTRAMLMRKIEEANTNVKDRNWLLWLTDAVMYMLPFGTTAAHTGVYETKRKDITDFILSGRRFNAEANNAWNAALSARTVDERQAVIDQVWEGINKNVTTWFGPNEILRLQMLHEYNVTPSVVEMNIMDGLQNMPTIGVAAYKTFTTPFKFSRALRGMGATAKASERVEEIAQVMQAEGKEAAMAKLGGTLDEVEEGLTPAAINPQTPVKLTKIEKVNKRYADITAKMDAAEDAGDMARFNELKRIRDTIDRGPDVSVNPLPDRSTTPISTADRLEYGRHLFERLMGGKLQHVARMNDQEKAKVLADLAERAKFFAVNRKNPRVVVDQEMVTTVLDNGSEVNVVHMTIGRSYKKGESPWYKTEAEAKRKAADRMGVRDYEIIKIGEDQYGVRIRLPIDETGTSLGGSRFYMPFNDKQKAGPFSWWSRYMGGGQVSGSEELKGLAQISFDKKNLINTKIKQEIMPRFFRLNDEERDVLRAVLAKGETDAVWYDDLQLEVFYRANFGSKANRFDRFQDAYNAAQDINDIEYYLRNVNELLELQTQGYELVNFNGLPLAPQEMGRNAKIFRSATSVPNEVIWDMKEGRPRIQNPTTSTVKGKKAAKYAKDSRLNLEDLQKRFAQGDAIVRFQEPVSMPDGSRVRFFLVEGPQLDIQKLSFQQLPYRAGGHRMYRNNYFIKKGVTGKQPWGEEFFDNPFTPTTAATLKEAQEWAENMNLVQNAYKEAFERGISGDDLVKAVADKLDDLDSDLGYPPAEEFVDWMKRYGADNPFEAVFDRENPSMYSGRNVGAGDSWGEALSGVNTYMQTQGRMYTSSKGVVLNNIRDWSKPADVYDPFTNMNTALTQIARLSSFTDFRIRSVNKWLATYEHALDIDPTSNMSPMKRFLEGKFKTGTKDLQQVKAAAELQRAYIKRILGWKSDFDLAVQSSTRKAMEWVATDLPEKTGASAKTKMSWAKSIHGIYDWVEEVNPINAAMGLAFDATMGLFNVSQYALQYQTSLAAASIDVSKGMQAMANLPAIHLWMRKAADAKTLDYLIERGAHVAAGFKDADDYRKMMEAIKRTGWLNGMLNTMKNEFGPQTALGGIGRTVDTLRTSGRFFTNLAEEQNRMNAWQMAWRMTREKFPDMSTDSPLFIERVRNMAGSLALNMDEAGAAAWQRNSLTRIPTQFMPYMFRWHELLWDPNFTTAQKLKFVAGQAFLYGTAGIPFAAWYFDEQEKNSGSVPAMGTVPGFINRGFADTLIWYATGADVTFSERAGIGAYPTDIIQELLGGGRFGETSAADLAGGAAGQIWGQFLDSSFKAMYYAAMESGGESGMPLTEASIKRAVRSISTLNNVLKAEAIINYGNYTNRKGEIVIDDLPSVYGFAAMLGMAPAELQKQTAEMGWLKKRTDRVKEWTEQVMIQRVSYGNALKSGDYAEADAIAKDINFISRYLLPKDIKADVLNKVYQDPRTRTVAESIAERYEKEKASGEWTKRMTEN